MTKKVSLCLVLTAFIATSCVNQPIVEIKTPPPPAVSSRDQLNKDFEEHLLAAQQLAAKGSFDEAIVQCAAAFRLDPTNPRLQALYNDIRTKQLAERALATQQNAATSVKHVEIEAKEKEILPPTFGTRRTFEPKLDPLKLPESPGEKLLKKTITMDLENAELTAILQQIGRDADIKFIADQSVVANKRITVNVKDTPLKEILDYFSRNLGVTFFAGENLLWVTASGAAAATANTVPMETRIYRLRKGVNLPEAEQIETESPATTPGGTGRRSPQRPRTSSGGGVAIPGLTGGRGGTGVGGGLVGGAGAGATTLEDVIATFVPQPPESALTFNRDAHVLIARNTRENLRLLEEIIEALDVAPLQVLIEARFVEIGVNDLRELGIEWILNSDYTVTKRSGGRNETVVRAGSGTQFPSPAPQPGGFNLTYTGLLTDPMFQAVLHALQSSGKSRTLAVPRVTTVNNRAAKIRIGQDFRYFERFERQSFLSSVTGTSGTPVYTNELVPVGSPTLEELGIQLVVLPSVGADQSAITLTLAPQNKEFVRFEDFSFGPQTTATGTLTPVGTATSGTIRLPIFTVSEVTTRVVVRSGDTVVMGGLVRTSTQQEATKVPILGDLPLVGSLFRRSNNTERRSNLLIFVTATLIGYNGESLVPVK